MPKFSVIIPLYNKEAHIVDTLKSVFTQTFTDYEIIIVNDGSTDNSLATIKNIDNSKLRIFDNVNKGVSEARNFAMQQAKGEYFAFLDADDIWLENHLQNLHKLTLAHPNCGMYCTNYIFDYGHFTSQPNFTELPKNENWSGIVEDYFLASLNFRIAWTSAIAIPKSTLLSIGLFDTKITLGAGEDTDYWMRIALKNKVVFTKTVSAIYKTSATNRISKIKPTKRNYMIFDKFIDEEKTNPSLKKFNDLHRYEYALHHKINNDIETFNYYIKDINWKNISLKMRWLIQLPSIVLVRLWQMKQWLKTKKIDFYIS